MSALSSCLKDTGNSKQIKSTMKQHGYFNNAKMCKTLQGSIWSATQPDTKASVVIKVTNKQLHNDAVTTVDGHQYYVSENILKETAILRYLTMRQDSPNSIVKYVDFFKDKVNFYLVMENGGQSFFDFLIKAHVCLSNNTIEVSEWHKLVQVLFKQMVNAVDYMHKNNVANFDISLENMLINDVDVIIDSKGDLQFVLDDTDNPIQLKLCDLGLAELFKSDKHGICDDISNKYVGKHCYKCPEIIAYKKTFSAMSNDVWCLGVCLFMMVIGGTPWKKAKLTDTNFQLIMNGKVMKVLEKWGLTDHVNDELLDLFNQIFQYEDERISISDLKQHSWLKQDL